MLSALQTPLSGAALAGSSLIGFLKEILGKNGTRREHPCSEYHSYYTGTIFKQSYRSPVNLWMEKKDQYGMRVHLGEYEY